MARVIRPTQSVWSMRRTHITIALPSSWRMPIVTVAAIRTVNF